MERVTRALWAARFTDATSADDIVTMCRKLTNLTGNSWEVASVDAATLALRETGLSGATADWPIQVGQVVVVDATAGIVDRLRPADFTARYRRESDIQADTRAALLADAAFIAAVAAAVGALP